jgi:hypothetical protein
MADGIIGRDPELASIASLLDGLASGAAAPGDLLESILDDALPGRQPGERDRQGRR